MISQLSLLPGQIGYIGAGTITDIEAIYAPSSASQGERVDVTVRIKNIDTYWDHLVSCRAIYDGSARFIDEAVIIRSGETHSFSGHFTMPGKDVTIYADSYYPYYQEWILDDQAQRDVKLKEIVGWQLLDSRTIPIKSRLPPVVGWQLLDSRTAIVKFVPPVVGWQLLDSKTIPVKSGAPPVVGWQLLDSKTMPVRSGLPPVVGWQLLDEKLVSLTAAPPEVPPEYELIQETIYPWAYVFEGSAETCIFEFKLTPEQIPTYPWLGERIVNAFVSELEKEGSRVLELRVYEDITPTFWTNYRVEVTATASPIAWMPIIIGVLAILFLVAIIFVLKTVDEVFFKRKALDEETKKTFARETLTAMILDLSPETPPETLEGMSDQELRDLLNRLLAEVAPPVDWLPLAILGGVALLGVGGAAAAFTVAKPKE